MKKFEKIFKSVANYRRLEILKFLKKRREASVGEISEAIKLSFKATSKHIGILYSAGFLNRDQVQLYMLYSISSNLNEPQKTILSFL